MDTTTILMASAGGALIGLASALLLLFNGQIAGISGVLGGLMTPQPGRWGWRVAFLGGLLAGGALLMALYPEAFPDAAPRGLPAIAAAGLLVGFGTRLGSGCTSGHGVCGLSRLSKRSMVAVGTFMGAGAITVLVARLLAGG